MENNVSFPIILFVDGHSSHLTLTLSEFCSEKEIILVALYPNATHIIQPLDVAFFRPLKMSWKNTVHTWRMEHNGAKICREDFAPLLEKSIEGMENKIKIISNGFRATGLFPFEVENINFSKYFRIDPEKSEASQNTTDKSYNNYYSINMSLKRMEKDLPEKVKLFKNSGDVWNGPTEDLGLYQYWKLLYTEKNKYMENNESLHNEKIDTEISESISDFLPVTNSSPSRSIDLGIDNIITEVLEENVDMSNMEGLLLDGDSLVIPFDTNQKLENLEGDLPSDLPQEPLIVIVPPREEANLASPLRSITENIITTVEQPNKILDSVPTPFKRALFWPDAKENTETKKGKKTKYRL